MKTLITVLVLRLCILLYFISSIPKFFFYECIFLVKQESLNTRASMSSEEKVFLQHLLSLEAFTPKQKILFDVAEKMYGKKIKQLEARDLVEFSTGENTLTEKALDCFKLDMEHHHASIAQLTFNMGKLAGN
jgi:hypothetical protein